MGKKSKCYIDDGFYNWFEANNQETPDRYKELANNLNELYERNLLMNNPFPSVSLVEHGFILNSITDDFITDGVLEIPEGIVTIRSTFLSNVKKSDIKSIIFPSSAIEIPPHILDGCFHVKSIKVSHGTTKVVNSFVQGIYVKSRPVYDYVELPGSVVNVTDNESYYYTEELKLNYGTTYLVLHNSGTLRTLWLPPTVNNLTLGHWNNFRALKDIYVFKGDSNRLDLLGINNLIKKNKNSNVTVHEVEDGWGDWRENLTLDYKKRIDSLNKKIDKYKVKLNDAYSENPEPLEKNIQFCEAKISSLESELKKKISQEYK